MRTIAEALAKEASGQTLTRGEQRALKNSQFGQRVSNELNVENIRSGEYSSDRTGQIDTNRINADEYSRLLKAAESAQEGETVAAEQSSSLPENALQAVKTEVEEQVAQMVEAPATAYLSESQRKLAYEARQAATEKNGAQVGANAAKVTSAVDPQSENVMAISEARTEAEEDAEEPVTLEAASKKYGAQAGAMIHTYTEGQDVERYDSAYQIAYDMGKSGVSLSYAMKSEATAYLTESQRELAYEAGQAAAERAAVELDAQNKNAANGKRGRRKGIVKGEGVTIADLKKSFNDPQGKAYRVLATIAEATGIDIVLYQSEIGDDGRLIGAQGKFKWSDDTIYIDINAGISYSGDLEKAAEYTMLRTFSHEFTHFLEKWNPIRYNEFRKTVFDTLTERGENVDDLIEEVQERNEGMTYDAASREVVAEAMTDVLPDANFVQTLAEQHKTVFEKLLEQLKAFVAEVKEYFASLAPNRSIEANALKEQVGGTVRYLESIVKLFDNVAVEAIERYQAAVAVEEATIPKTEKVEESPTKIDSTEATNAYKDADFAENAQNEDVTHPKTDVNAEKKATSAKSEKKTPAPKSSENAPSEKATTEVTEVTKETEAPKTIETTVKLEDFGEKIGGARKDDWGKRGLLSSDLSEMNDRERDKAVKKDNVWKRPDYRKLIEGGDKREILFARNEIRKSLNQNLTYPRLATEERKLELQKVFVDTVREIQAMAEKATTAADIKAMGYEWLLKNGYLEVTNGYRSADKWRGNPALHLSNYVQTIEHLVRNFDKLGKLAEQANFAVDAESKVPAGYSIREDDKTHTWYIAKGRYIVQRGFSSHDEALAILKNAASKTKKKARFVPKQLLGVHRKGPDYRAGNDVKGQDYLDTFGFKGGEFGNWMSEKDRRVSMNYGFDALKDLADALGIADSDISLSSNLSIAFGARGQGLSGAAAHYERERHVINLTKMNGAGSLAHEWFHALDDFAGGYGNLMSTDNLRALPERTREAMRALLSTMQYRDATQEETDMAATKRYEQARRSVEYQVKAQFRWVERVENGTLTDSDARYYARKPTEADAKRYHELLDKLLATGDASVVDELSALRKAVNGHVIAKEDRDAIGYRLSALTPSETQKVQKMRLRSDYYNGSRRFGELHQKDGDYWDSTVEMAARAFACYVADKTNAQNDYLSAHSDSAATLDVDKKGNPVIVKAFPEGQERTDINRAFDELIAAMKADGILHERGEIVKPDTVQYQAREYLDEARASKAFSRQFEKDVIDDYGITDLNDYIHVQRQVFRTLVNDGFFVNSERRSRTDVNEATGMVIETNKSSIDETFNMSNYAMLGKFKKIAKLATVKLLPEIIKNGVLTSDNVADYHQNASNKKFAYISYDTVVDGVSVTVKLDIKKSPIKNKLWVHSISAEKDSTGLDVSSENGTGTSYRTDAIKDIVAQKDEIVKNGFSDTEQNQQRTNTLTDREVLAMAADQVKIDDLNAAEQDALRIFRERLEKLEKLQLDRAEQGRLYKEQQFGAKVDRDAAAKTLNRMHVFDEQIKRASADVLAVEETTVLKQVLQKARKVVEAEERKHGQERLARWRDRRNNAAAIKKYRERIRHDVDELTNWILKPSNKDAVKHVPDVLKSSVIPFLSSIDFTSKRQLSGGDATKADQAFEERLNKLKKGLENVQETYDGLYSGYTDLPPNFMKRLDDCIETVRAIINQNSDGYVINQMTADELNELSKVVKTLKQYITNFNRFHANAMYQYVYEAGNNTIEALEQMKDDGGKAGMVSNFVLWQQMRPAYAFERFGEGGKAIYDGFRRGQSRLAFNAEKIIDFSKKTYTAEEVKAWKNEIKEVKLSSGTLNISVAEAMAFYELNKRPQAKTEIYGDGIRVERQKDRADAGRKMTQEDAAAIIGVLTDRQKEVADALQKYMAEQGGKWGNYVSVARFGEEMFGEPTYFPINSDGRRLQSTAEEEKNGNSLYALLNMSFTHQLTENATSRIIIYDIFDVFANHMADMAQYNAMALPVLDALKWFNYTQRTDPDENGKRSIKTTVREQMARVYGSDTGKNDKGYAVTFVSNILKAFNGTEAQGSTYDALGLNSLRRYNISQVSWNLGVMIQQPLAITRAGMLLDAGSILKAMKDLPSLKKNVAEMREYSGIAVWKSLGFYDVNISRGLTDLIKHESNWIEKAGEIGMKGAELMDTLTWASIWSACKEEVMKKQQLKPSDKGFYDAVTNLFEDVVYKTQVVDSVLTKNEYLRSKSPIARTFGSFMGEPTTTASMAVDAFDKYSRDIQRGMTRSQAWQKNRKLIARTICVYAIGQILQAAVESIRDAYRDDDDYEDFFEKWWEAFWGLGGNLLNALNPLNKLPIASQGVEVLKELIAAGGKFDIYGQMTNFPFVDTAEQLIKGVEIIQGLISGDEKSYTWYGGIYKLLQAASGMSGLPMASFAREAVTFWNNVVGAMAPSLKVKTYDSGDKNEIKYAYMDGYLSAEEATELLLEKGLAETEDEAYWLIEEWDADGDYSRYGAVYDAVLNGGDFDAAMDEMLAHGYTESDVLKQVKSQIGRWYYDDKSDVRITKQQAIDMLTKYTDMESDEITAQVNKWSCKIVTGIAYGDIGDEFLEGNITEKRAIEMYMRYGGVSEKDATEKVAALAFEKEHPECKDISYAAVEAYKKYCEPAGVEAELYYKARKKCDSFKSDKDEDDEPIPGKEKRDKVVAYIDTLDLSVKQKDAIYFAVGYKKSTLYKTPWH